MSNALNSKISIHTFMIGRQIKGTTWQALKNKFYMEAKGHKDILAVYESRKLIVFNKYMQDGVTVYLTWTGSEKYTKYHRIGIRVNPRRLIGDDTFIGVFEITQDNLNLLDMKLKEILYDLGFYTHGHYLVEGLETFILSRADICINFYLDEIDMFIDVARKCFVPKGFKKLKHKNGKIPIGGVYLESKNMNVQIYKKLAKMLSDDYEYSREELIKAENLARFEVQLHRIKIYNWIKSGKLPRDFENGLSGIFIALVCAAHKLIFEYAIKIFGDSPYRSSRYICDKLNSLYSTVEQNVLLDYIEKLESCHDAEKVARKIGVEYTHNKIASLMGKMNANVVPIDNRFIRHGIQVLPSVPQMIFENIKTNKEYLEELLKLNSDINGITYFYKM